MTLLDDRRSSTAAEAASKSGSKAGSKATAEPVSRRSKPATGRADAAASSRRKAGQRPAQKRGAVRTASTTTGRRGTGTATAVRAAGQPMAEGLLTGLRRMPMVFPMIVLVVGTLALTLYLSTKAQQDAYALATLRSENQSLTDQRDDLKRVFDSGDSAPELADKAGKLGMVPAKDAAHLVVGADGKARIKGEPGPVSGRKVDSLNPKPDPVAQIDASKVDDSTGLNGGPAPEQQPADAEPKPEEGQPEERPAAGQPEEGQPAAEEPAAEPTADRPAPNVRPSVSSATGSATPSRNAPSGR